jgi:endoglycosylceramidase
MPRFHVLILALLITTLSLSAEIKFGLRDEAGRHVVARGFVVVTNDGGGDVDFTADDYARMVRMGANYQVIRLELAKLSHFPGAKLDENYLLRLDRLVAFALNTGMKTVFKMTGYSKGFSWEQFWLNQRDEWNLYQAAWQVIWTRYKDDVSVAGYDLINEPRKLTMDISYDDLTAKYLVPAYQRLIDASHRVNPDKVCLCQGIFMNKGEGVNGNQYAGFPVPIGRANIYYSPNIYLSDPEKVEPVLAALVKTSESLNAPMFVGEWGFPTFDKTDASVVEQQKYARLYIDTAAAFDRLGVGIIKAWFSGNRTKQHFLGDGPSTWAIFSDESATGSVERKYITDIISRPYPQVIAGDLHSFAFDFATRSLAVALKTDNHRGASRIFVGANRHYPDGFSVVCGDALILHHNPLKTTGLEAVKSDRNFDPANFIWDEATQQMIILRWPVDHQDLVVKIVPGRAALK